MNWMVVELLPLTLVAMTSRDPGTPVLPGRIWILSASALQATPSIFAVIVALPPLGPVPPSPPPPHAAEKVSPTTAATDHRNRFRIVDLEPQVGQGNGGTAAFIAQDAS